MKKGDDSEIIKLHNKGVSFREIGKNLGISHVAVRKRYLRAMAVNRDIVNPEDVNSDAHGNLTKPELSENSMLRIAKVSSAILEDGLTPAMESPRTVCQSMETGADRIVKSSDLLKKVEPIASSKNPFLVTKEEYLIHRPSGRIIQKGAKAYPKGALEPYTPPKYLRKVDGPNRGDLFPWTFYLAQRKDMMPFAGDPSSISITQVTNPRDKGK